MMKFARSHKNNALRYGYYLCIMGGCGLSGSSTVRIADVCDCSNTAPSCVNSDKISLRTTAFCLDQHPSCSL